MVKSNEAGFRKYGVYSNDKMVASFTLGFWTFLFTKNNYRKGGKTLLKIFPNKAKGKNQADIYLDLTHIREFVIALPITNPSALMVQAISAQPLLANIIS